LSSKHQLPLLEKLFTSKCQNLTAAASNSARRHGPTVARSIVLEAVNLDQGSEFSSIAQVNLHALYIVPVLIQEPLYLKMTEVLLKLHVSIFGRFSKAC
jgi:hypothetical protein